ncbi:ATP-dependent endonuclease [Polynucleobacter sp. AP-RePozz3-80-G7]|uniref:ATP-dependent nuclease n=1 Tax=Polynucleobacter sp. AP-RePozz3-80-G7 TaxID=2689105 RepID=UPI001C0AF21D|nr:ATP-binding protein [Polynucleobacter sp. AP-RePozz3-80-G7]MBU3639632.1 AAA family ATPase [Polynucleobacter sp. AP-RePozz3-80-G7]
MNDQKPSEKMQVGPPSSSQEGFAEVRVTNLSVANLSPQIASKSSKTIRWTKLRSIEIKNFKAIDSIDLPLSDVTILVGPNGSGKSSVLQAIHWAARAASYIPPRKQSEVINFERLDYSPSSDPLKMAHKKELSSDRGTAPTVVTFNHLLPEDGTPLAANIKIWAARNRGGIAVHIDGGVAVSPFKQRDDVITAYIPGLAGLSERETILVQPLLRRQAASGDAGGVLRNVLFNIASQQPGELDSEPAKARVKRLNELVQIIHPNVRLEVGFDDREDINIRALFEDKLLSGLKRPLETAATGVLQVIQIFAYLILFRPKLLLIDEPDAHLHPDKQERLIEALEQAAAEFNVQAVLTTHSPHIVRAASPNANLVWVKDGQIVEHEDDAIRALLGWGGLDKRILFFVEDEDDQPIRAILRQWPHLYRQIAICRCFGVDNLPRNALLDGLIGDNAFGINALIHRDRDFMIDAECKMWRGRYKAERTTAWITEYVDVEGYFCQPKYLAALYGITEEIAVAWIKDGVSRCIKDAKNTFYDKRKVINRMLYENGGSPATDELWMGNGETSKNTVLGKTLHKALKVVAKENNFSDKLLDRFTIPENFETAPDLKSILEDILNQGK